jgi:hypothetical protein
MGMWWPYQKPDGCNERLEVLISKRNGVVTWVEGSAKDAALRALDDFILDEAKRQTHPEQSVRRVSQ